MLLAAFGAAFRASAAFVNFESGHVRPLALSPDGSRLFAVNTPDGRLAVYDVTPGGLTLAAEVPVGLEPVAVAARTNLAGRTEAWVVNHLSDSVSVVEVDPADVALSRVTRTLLVGDEPRDIVFAGSGQSRVFITCARRGQNRFPTNPDTGPELATSGVGRADVWAFDANTLGAALGGAALSIIQLFGDTPRALAAVPDGSIVYAAIFDSGNRTTVVFEDAPSGVGCFPPPPPGSTPGAPPTSLVVKFNPAADRWENEFGEGCLATPPFSLPDRDVFIIDADADPPALAGGSNFVTGVGTVLFNMAVRPTNGKLYVTNTEARNQVRFEPAVRGHVAESRITVITGRTAVPHHLNPHVDYSVTPGPPSEVERSLAIPTDMAFSPDGRTLFVAAFGSGKVGVLDADALEAGIIAASQLEVGGGPSGLVVDAARDRLYVMNRFDHTISIVRNANQPWRAVTDVVPIGYDPSPPAVREGRRFLYDARTTSGHGDTACASCHVFGDFDGLAWDLGDPFGPIVNNPNPFRIGVGRPFHPLKGPMTTQSVRGLAEAGPMHWRGDRTGGGDPGGDPLSAEQAFKKFNPAFVGLLGRGSQLAPAEMQALTDFVLTIRYPPNPIRALSDAPTPAQAAGKSIFLNNPSDGSFFTCIFCHRLPLGTDGLSSFEEEPQDFKIPHLRNLYQKVGMFSAPGEQIRGFGFRHDSAIPTLFDFLGFFTFPNPDLDRRQLEAFLLAFDTGLKPAVGQQVSLTPATVNDAAVNARIDLLIARDEAGDCDLVVKGNVDGQARGAVYVGAGTFQRDRNDEAPISNSALRRLAGAAGQEQVYTCGPPGSGTRLGVDRDEDGFFDRTELDVGTDPADPLSFPGAPSAPVLVPTQQLTITDDVVPPTNPSRRHFSFESDTRGNRMHRIVPAAPGSAGDPREGGGRLFVYNSNPAPASPTDAVTVLLPAERWRPHGKNGYSYRDDTPGAPVSQVVVKPDALAIRGGGAGWTYTLDEPAQGRIAVRLELGADPGWCADAPARVCSSARPTARCDRAGSFTAQPHSPAPTGCPAPKAGG